MSENTATKLVDLGAIAILIEISNEMRVIINQTTDLYNTCRADSVADSVAGELAG